MKNLKTKLLSAAVAVLCSAGASYALFTASIDRLQGTASSLPVLTSCGSGALSAGSGDMAGSITNITSGCVATFGTAFATAPTCVLHDRTTTGGTRAAVTATAMTITATGADTVDYICIAKAGG